MLWTALQYLEANHIAGDYAEFGVWRGDTLATAFHFAKGRARLAEARFIAFDSFEGFPKLRDADIHPTFQAGGRSFSLEDFLRQIGSRGVPNDRLTTYKGWFADSLAFGGTADLQVPDDSFSLVWADCDLYESTRDMLPFVARKIRPGGIIAFDNWFCFDADPLRGEQRAVNEFLADSADTALIPFYRFGWHGQSFVWHCRTTPRREIPESLEVVSHL
jgi:O-methyltransferase